MKECKALPKPLGPGAAESGRALVPLVLFLLIAAVGVYFLQAGGREQEGDPRGSELESPDAAVLDLVPDAPAGLESQGPEQGEGKKPEVPEELRQLIDTEEPTSNSGKQFLLQVWDRKKGIPAGGAEVRFVDWNSGVRRPERYAEHWTVFAEDHGTRLVTDASGKVELPSFSQRALIVAKGTGTFGFVQFGPKHPELVELILVPDETVTVRVLDRKDRPVAKVPVGILQRIPERRPVGNFEQLMAKRRALLAERKRTEAYGKDHPEQKEAVALRLQKLQMDQERLNKMLGDEKKRLQKSGKRKGKGKKPAFRYTTAPRLRAERLTSASGLAVFRHFQIYRQQARKFWKPIDSNRFQAALLLPAQRLVSVTFAGKPVPEEVLKLRLPSTGALSLRTVDRKGRPFLHPVVAEIEVLDAEAMPWGRTRVRKRQGEASIDFPFVGLGVAFRVSCHLDDRDFTWRVPRVMGPSKEDQKQEVDILVAPEAGMLHGRVLGPDGKVLAGQRLEFLVNASTGRVEGEELILGPKGGFHLPFLVRPQQSPPFQLVVRSKDAATLGGVAKRLSRLQLRDLVEVGDLRLAPMDPIASGTVRDDRGQAVAGAVVQLQGERVRGPGQTPSWGDEAFAAVVTDQQGKFELRALLDPGRYRLSVEAKDHFSYFSEAIRIGQKLEVSLSRKSRIVGTVLLPAWLPSRKIQVRLEEASDLRKRRDDRIRDYRGKRYIYFDWVHAGVYNVVLRSEDFPDPILRIDGLMLRAGQQGLHPRLTNLDLRAYLHRFVISAVDTHGKALSPGAPLLARIERPGGGNALVGFPWKGNRTTIICTTPSLEVLPLAHGYRAKRTVLQAGESELRFAKVEALVLRVPGLRQVVGNTAVWMVARLVDSEDLPDKLNSWDGRSERISNWFVRRGRQNYVQLDKHNQATLALTHDGKYGIYAYFVGGGAKSALDLGQVDVRLAPGSPPQLATLSFDREAVERILGELQSGSARGRGK